MTFIGENCVCRKLGFKCVIKKIKKNLAKKREK